jgi:hypothetical protein
MRRDYIDPRYKLAALVQDSSLYQFLKSIPDFERTARKYYLGSVNYYGVSPVYFYIDQLGNIRGGKTMGYKNGRRVKESTTMIHSLYKDHDYNYSSCLYGEHLLTVGNKNVPVCVVESEKTALVADCMMPGNIWLATGGKSSFTQGKINALKGRNVILWPDLDSYPEWEAVGQKNGFKVNQYLKSIASPEQIDGGWDLGDFLLSTVNYLTD